jgi:hypothetical protein
LACRNAHVRFSNGFSAVGPEIGIEEDRMKLKKTCRAVTLATALATGSVSAAAAQDWHYAASIYAFMPETNTTIGTLNHGPIESTLSFSDALDNLDFTFMGTLEASNDRWSVIGDFLLFDLSFGNPTPGTNVSQVNTAIKAQMFNGYLAYRVYDDPGLEVDLAAGFRWFDVSSGIDLLQGSTVVGSSSADENWVDPLVAGPSPALREMVRHRADRLWRVQQRQRDLAGASDGGLPDQRSMVGRGRLSLHRCGARHQWPQFRLRPVRPDHRRDLPVLKTLPARRTDRTKSRTDSPIRSRLAGQWPADPAKQARNAQNGRQRGAGIVRIRAEIVRSEPLEQSRKAG